MTFGCKVDDKVFVPRNGRGQFGLNTQYIYLDEGHDKGHFLSISATEWKSVTSVRIYADSLLVEEGKTYSF